MLTVNDNSVFQDRNGSKTNLQDRLQRKEGGVKSKRLYKREVREVGRRDLKGRGHKVGEKKRGES